MRALTLPSPRRAYWQARAARTRTATAALGSPAGRHELVLLDMATAVMALGRIAQLKAAGTELPPGVAVTEAGEPTTDPALAKVPLPVGGAKGSGMSLVFELLAHGFQRLDVVQHALQLRLGLGQILGRGFGFRRDVAKLLFGGVLVGERALKLRRQLGYVDAEIGVGLAFKGQHVGKLAHLAGEALQRLVAAGERDAQIELGQHEDDQQKGNDQEQRRQGIDEAGPDIDVARRAAARCDHDLSNPHQRVSSSAKAAMVRASSLISLRISWMS